MRRAQLRDLAALCALNAMLDARDAFSRPRLRALLKSGRVLLACEQAQPAGFCIAVPRASGINIQAIMVTPQFRRRGYAREMLQAALKGRAKARCEIRASNVASEGLFRKAGFTLKGMKPGVYADHEAALEFEFTARR